MYNVHITSITLLVICKTWNMKDYSYNKLTCNDSIWDTNLLLNISDYCLTNIPDIDFSKDCFPNELSGFTITTIAEGVWIIINAVIGFVGNLLTILAITFAAHKNK